MGYKVRIKFGKRIRDYGTGEFGKGKPYKTRYLLATRISRSRTTRDAQTLYDRAVKTAGKEPQKVITDKLASYLDVRYGKDTEHIQSRPFAVENNTQMIERFHETLKQRTKVMEVRI